MSKAKTRLPFLPWFPDRFISTHRGWSVTARGVFRELYDCQWEMLGLPADPADLQQLIGATKAEWQASWALVEPEYPIDADGLRRNASLEVDRARSLALVDRRRAGAEKTNAKRWGPLRLVSNSVAQRSVSESLSAQSASRSALASIPIPSDAYQGGELTTEVRARGNSDVTPSGKPIRESAPVENSDFSSAFDEWKRGRRGPS